MDYSWISIIPRGHVTITILLAYMYVEKQSHCVSRTFFGSVARLVSPTHRSSTKPKKLQSNIVHVKSIAVLDVGMKRLV